MKRLIYIFLACLCLVACHKGSTSRGFLANDLSYKLYVRILFLQMAFIRGGANPVNKVG